MKNLNNSILHFWIISTLANQVTFSTANSSSLTLPWMLIIVDDARKNVFLFLRNSIFVFQRQHWQCISLLLGAVAVHSLHLQSIQLQYSTWLWTGGFTNIFYLNLQSSFSHKVTMYIHSSISGTMQWRENLQLWIVEKKSTVKFDSKFILLVFFYSAFASSFFVQPPSSQYFHSFSSSFCPIPDRVLFI